MSEENLDEETKEIDSGEKLDEKKSKISKKSIIKILLVIFLSLASISGGLVTSMGLGGVGDLFFGQQDSKNQKETKNKGVDTSYKEQSKDLNILNMNEMIVNIKGQTLSGRTTSRFLKIQVSIVYEKSDEFDKITKRKPFLRDSFQDYLRQIDEKELIGTAGLVKLKSELLKRAQLISDNLPVKEVLISDLVIQ
jgi:flagellar FliL protein